MAGRFLAVLAGLAGAAAGSQAPEFTAHYMQNLVGRIDELRTIVEEFDADVGRYGFSRSTALLECETADGVFKALCDRYAATVKRYEFLTAHLSSLEAASHYARPLVLAQNVQRDIVDSVMEEFKPAIPATLDGAAYAGGGFAVLWGGASFIFGLLGALFSGGRRYA